MISLSWPRFCVLWTLFRLFDLTIVSRIISWFYFLVSSLVFSLMVLHISAYPNRCLSSHFPTISHRFVIRARVGDNILDLSGSVIAVVTVDSLCWIKSGMFSLMGSMSSSSCSHLIISFPLPVGIRSSLMLFVWHLLIVASWSSMLSFPPLRPV